MTIKDIIIPPVLRGRYPDGITPLVLEKILKQLRITNVSAGPTQVTNPAKAKKPPWSPAKPLKIKPR